MREQHDDLVQVQAAVLSMWDNHFNLLGPMNLNQANDLFWSTHFGLRFFPYQVGVGLSVSWWPIFRFQLYLGPLRMWIAFGNEAR